MWRITGGLTYLTIVDIYVIFVNGMRYLYPVIVGEMVTIGHNATVHGCVLEDAVLVGIGATILNNARIGEGSIIAAGALIPEQTVIPPNSLVAGVPGKIALPLPVVLPSPLEQNCTA